MRYLIFISFISFAIFSHKLMAQENDKLNLSKIEITAKFVADNYINCLYDNAKILFKYDQSEKSGFALFRIKDEDVYQAGKKACAGKREAVLQAANDGGVTARMIDESEKNAELFLLESAKRSRATLTPLADAIRAPGPRKAVSLRRGIISADDYPPAAVRNNESGEVTATFVIGKDGKVTQCSATGASELLNTTTCNITKRRSSYAPALDASQSPIEDTVTQRTRWSLPSGN